MCERPLMRRAEMLDEMRWGPLGALSAALRTGTRASA